MYTEEGNWDIVGNNIPVFFIQGKYMAIWPVAFQTHPNSTA